MNKIRTIQNLMIQRGGAVEKVESWINRLIAVQAEVCAPLPELDLEKLRQEIAEQAPHMADLRAKSKALPSQYSALSAERREMDYTRVSMTVTRSHLANWQTDPAALDNYDAHEDAYAAISQAIEDRKTELETIHQQMEETNLRIELLEKTYSLVNQKACLALKQMSEYDRRGQLFVSLAKELDSFGLYTLFSAFISLFTVFFETHYKRMLVCHENYFNFRGEYTITPIFYHPAQDHWQQFKHCPIGITKVVRSQYRHKPLFGIDDNDSYF